MISAGEQVWGIGWRGRILALIGVSVLALAISLVASVARAGATVPKETDIMIIFDTSGSMEGVLEEAKEEIKTLVANTEASLPNVEFGVANVEDIPGYFGAPLESLLTEKEYEENGEKPWRLEQSLTLKSPRLKKRSTTCPLTRWRTVAAMDRKPMGVLCMRQRPTRRSNGALAPGTRSS